ncbi:hypothetical protein [Marispirochaeta aestuarii]|uniref:hypothetical protein n=1 Tax=Marispirochaeta aestuarii TaxID=1963862 RepID=UPI0029C86460|nr:hypothetical protein [Marispirochaeta aestuarii]
MAPILFNTHFENIKRYCLKDLERTQAIYYLDFIIDKIHKNTWEYFLEWDDLFNAYNKDPDHQGPSAYWWYMDHEVLAQEKNTYYYWIRCLRSELCDQHDLIENGEFTEEQIELLSHIHDNSEENLPSATILDIENIWNMDNIKKIRKVFYNAIHDNFLTLTRYSITITKDLKTDKASLRFFLSLMKDNSFLSAGLTLDEFCRRFVSIRTDSGDEEVLYYRKLTPTLEEKKKTKIRNYFF